MSISVKKIEVGSPPVEYFLITESRDKRWKMYLLCIEQHKVYNFNVSERELRLMAAECPITTFDIYLSDALCAFGCCEPGEDQIIHYFLKENKDSTMFEWKKKVSGGMRVQLGELELQEKDFNTSLAEIFDLASLDMAESKRKIQELEMNVTKKENEKLSTQAVLDETLLMKSNLETDLFTKFAKVLNSKKKKIKELYDEIESVKRSQKSKKSPVPVKSTKKSRANQNIEVMEEDINQPGPSKRKKDSQDSLLLSSEEEEEVVKPASKPRQRVCKQMKTGKVVNGGNKPSTASCDVKKKAVIGNTFEEDVDGLFDDL